VTGILNNLTADPLFDSILYVDVIEHIEDDAAEIRRAASHLAKDGHLAVLCSARQSLYSPFDKSVGHYRQYSKRMFRPLRP